MPKHTALAITLLGVPALIAQAPAKTTGQQIAAARPAIKAANDAFDFEKAQQIALGLLPTTKPTFDATSVRAADQSTKAYADYTMAYYMAYQACDNMGQWEKGREYLKTACDLAKESVESGKAKLTEARDDYKKLAGQFQALLDRNAEAVAALKAKSKLEDYEEASMTMVKDWEARKAENDKWAAFFQYDLDWAQRQYDDFKKFLDAQDSRIKGQNEEIAKFILQRDKKIKDMDAEVAKFTVEQHHKSQWAEGVVTTPAYMNAFPEKADKVAFVRRLIVLDPESPALRQALKDVLDGKSGVQPKAAAKARKK
ncbi:hypothetical protein [Mesoterricola sediminis]|nr:hypothetical protein [Mesoterricola sediminis]